MTWAVEGEPATVTEANEATEVVMPLDTLRMLADQLKTVLMTLVERESLDIFVGSGSGEGLEAWRRSHKRWDPLTTGRAKRMRYTAKKRRTEWSAPYVGRRHQDGGVGSASS